MAASSTTSRIRDFRDRFAGALEKGTFLRLTLSKPARKAKAFPRRQTARPIELRGERHLQWTLDFERRQTHENLTPDESVQRAAAMLGRDYRHAHLLTSEVDLTARVSKSGDCRLIRTRPSKPSASPTPVHDRRKQYLIPENVACPFLEALGVMTSDGGVRKSKQHKFRQINRFLQFVDDVYADLPAEGRIEVVDFGCGLSYLTFALHHLLSVIRGRDVRIRGIDRSESVIARCRQISRALDLDGLEFDCGDIAALTGESAGGKDVRVHLAVLLHACDTATDDALAAALRMQARVILAAPCCQHELFTRLAPGAAGPAPNDGVAGSQRSMAPPEAPRGVPGPQRSVAPPEAPRGVPGPKRSVAPPDVHPLALLTRHGILRERFAALATDALRAAVLEQAGYRTQVIEFIETEHTPKNLLLRAVRRQAGAADPQLPARLDALKQLLGIDQTRLETLLDPSTA